MLTKNQKERLTTIFKQSIISDIFSIIILIFLCIYFWHLYQNIIPVSFILIFFIPVIINLISKINRINAIRIDNYEILIDTVTKKYKNKKNYYLMIANKRSNISCDPTLWFNLKKGDNIYYIKIKSYAFAFAISE